MKMKKVSCDYQGILSLALTSQSIILIKGNQNPRNIKKINKSDLDPDSTLPSWWGKGTPLNASYFVEL